MKYAAFRWIVNEAASETLFTFKSQVLFQFGVKKESGQAQKVLNVKLYKPSKEMLREVKKGMGVGLTESCSTKIHDC